jgi:hypothetical protein
LKDFRKLSTPHISQAYRTEREEYLGSLGVDPMYFGVKEYRLAQLRDLLAEFELMYAEMVGHFKGLYKNLRVMAEVEYREPTPA